MAGILLLLLIILVVFGVRHRKYRRRASTPRTHSAAEPAIDNWSIPRPQPRVWQTSATIMSSKRRRKRRGYDDGDDDDDFEDDLELHELSNGHAVQPLHRSANGGLSFLGPDRSSPIIARSPAAARHGAQPSSSSRNEVEPLPTPRLRRYVIPEMEPGQ